MKLIFFDSRHHFGFHAISEDLMGVDFFHPYLLNCGLARMLEIAAECELHERIHHFRQRDPLTSNYEELFTETLTDFFNYEAGFNPTNSLYSNGLSEDKTSLEAEGSTKLLRIYQGFASSLPLEFNVEGVSYTLDDSALKLIFVSLLLGLRNKHGITFIQLVNSHPQLVGDILQSYGYSIPEPLSFDQLFVHAREELLSTVKMKSDIIDPQSPINDQTDPRLLVKVKQLCDLVSQKVMARLEAREQKPIS